MVERKFRTYSLFIHPHSHLTHSILVTEKKLMIEERLMILFSLPAYHIIQ